jgi:hypothetical protein
MGTSKSSGGAPGGVPMVPPWTPDPGAPEPAAPALTPDGDDGAQPQPIPAPAPQTLLPQQVGPIAPPARFGGARASLGKFASSGSASDMRRGIGHYTHKGLGGATTASRRMGGTSLTANNLLKSLTNLASGTTAAGGQLDPGVLQGRSAAEITTAIVEAIRPVDGTQDTEASRNAIQNALSQLLATFPNADLLNLSDDQRWLVAESYLATDIFNRIQLDVGKAIQDKAPTATVALQRLAEVNNYVRQTVAAQLRKLHAKGGQVTSKQMGEIIRGTVRETFEVFEGYAE